MRALLVVILLAAEEHVDLVPYREEEQQDLLVGLVWVWPSLQIYHLLPLLDLNYVIILVNFGLPEVLHSFLCTQLVSLPVFDLEVRVKTTEEVTDELDLVLVSLLVELSLLLPLVPVDCISLLRPDHPRGIHGVELVELRLLLSRSGELLGLLLVLEVLKPLKFCVLDVNHRLSTDLGIRLSALRPCICPFIFVMTTRTQWNLWETPGELEIILACLSH